ncbi:MAG: hypothetical protein CMJ18_07285 [Phycisphaeraceae bacterium]|nr:hypothetical protein [Phycisphaeraceae bacterium]
MTETHLPRFHGDTILLDIDETVTRSTGRSAGEVTIDALYAVVAQVQGVDVEEAVRLVAARCDPHLESIEPHLGALGLSTRMLWDVVRPMMASCVGVHDDAVDAVRALHARGFRLYPATTNSRFMALLKLSVAGLGDVDGSEHFNDVFGGSEVVAEGKTGPAFYHAVLERTGSRAQQTIHVGDDPQLDALAAQQAGIDQVVLVNRDLEMPWSRADTGAVTVRSLRTLADIVDQPEDG